MNYVEQNCTFEHEGRTYEAGGAVVFDDFAIGYVKAERECVGAPIQITDWHGKILGHGLITAKWRIPRSWYSAHMLQVEATIDGVRYTGRSGGNGMIWRGKKCKKQA